MTFTPASQQKLREALACLDLREEGTVRSTVKKKRDAYKVVEEQRSALIDSRVPVEAIYIYIYFNERNIVEGEAHKLQKED